ncbi:MAG: FtsB family cell division protein [Saprospiraceae bacterium]
MSTNTLHPILRKLPPPFRNRYSLTLICFGIWMLLIDRHDLWTQWKLSATMRKLGNDRAYYKSKIEEISNDEKDVQLHKEKYAREKYFMSKANEDVFIIEDKTK